MSRLRPIFSVPVLSPVLPLLALGLGCVCGRWCVSPALALSCVSGRFSVSAHCPSFSLALSLLSLAVASIPLLRLLASPTRQQCLCDVRTIKNPILIPIWIPTRSKLQATSHPSECRKRVGN